MTRNRICIFLCALLFKNKFLIIMLMFANCGAIERMFMEDAYTGLAL